MKNITTKNKLKFAIVILGVILLVLISFLNNLKDLKQTVNPDINNEKVGISVPTSPEKVEKEESEKDKIIEEKDIKTNSMDLRLLINNGWDRVKAKFSTGYIIDENGNYVHDEGYTLYCNSTKVKNVVFNSKYQDEIIGGLKIGASFKEIKNVLGEPTFENKELDMIGYKTKEVYAFFYEDEVSIYPNKSLSNEEFEILLFAYVDGSYDGNRTNFVVEVKREYPDFVAEQDGTNVILYSLNRQIEITLGEDGSTSIIIYNGYNKESITKYYLENNLDKVKKEKDDFIEIKEIERIEAK